ncbi:MAG: hypothetical protein IJQ35_04900 [Bacteroidales bacterium]|nr:hypothetical protein [Bacteroidales bacterium]
MKRALLFIGRLLGSLALLFLLLVWITGVSPIYNFRAPQPFSGPDIFNPYSAMDSASAWKRANFHTHTRVKGPWPMNECPYDAAYTDSVLRSLGYDIVTFSNHNEITEHPYDSTLQVNVYEQGYSPFKFHKLVFGSPSVKHWDPLLPLLASQMQFELDRLGADSDFIQINHPYRTVGTTGERMALLSGYQLMELDTHISTENEYWDAALSAGHYSFGLANDDLHHPERHWLTAIRCNFLRTPSGTYEDIRKTLRSGCFYAMRVPDYGDGDWAVKREKNRELPTVEAIGLEGNELYLTLSQKADSIRIGGAGHRTLLMETDTCSIRYALPEGEPYARMTAFFPDGAVIYTNPFARYDASVRESPFDPAPQPVNLPLTLLFNLLLAVLCAGTAWLLFRLWK